MRRDRRRRVQHADWTSNSRMLVFVDSGQRSIIGHRSHDRRRKQHPARTARGSRAALYATYGDRHRDNFATLRRAAGRGTVKVANKASTRPARLHRRPGRDAGQPDRRTQSRSRRSTKADAVDFALSAVVFIPGLAIGSFLNVVAARVPRKRSIVSPGSACMSCGHELAWYENVPVLSWLALRGKCKGCGERIGVVYPAVELADRAADRGLVPRLRLVGEVVRRRVLLRDARHRLRDRPLAPDRPQRDRAAGDGRRARLR